MRWLDGFYSDPPQMTPNGALMVQLFVWDEERQVYVTAKAGVEIPKGTRLFAMTEGSGLCELKVVEE